ncbi:MAG: amidohydrolase family protein [Acidimicrobiia bacterium]
MSAGVIPLIQIVDADTHLVEPPDLWTARMPSRWADMAPHVRWDEQHQEEAWFVGDQRLAPVAAAAQAGWSEYPPDHPRRWADADPATWDPKLRLGRMDEYGIHAQVLYPNVALFNSAMLQEVDEAEVQLATVQAYNDYQTEFASVAPDRFLPMTSLPFWDLAATLQEMQRCADAGHKGIVFSQDPSAFGLPGLTDRHWDPMWAAAQEMRLPVNFHIASGDTSLLDRAGHPDNGPHANYASMGVSFFLGNARTIAQLTCGGICHRFPELAFVSVESGIGWIPFALDSLDWQWKNCGVHLEHPEYDLLPSEYFARQIYGCFWFERDTALFAIERLGADNVLFETDFPHPTSMSPGPATAAVAPDVYIDEVFGGLPDDTLRKILHDNAARIYHLDP